jgi:hypothetical protein
VLSDRDLRANVAITNRGIHGFDNEGVGRWAEFEPHAYIPEMVETDLTGRLRTIGSHVPEMSIRFYVDDETELFQKVLEPATIRVNGLRIHGHYTPEPAAFLQAITAIFAIGITAKVRRNTRPRTTLANCVQR